MRQALSLVALSLVLVAPARGEKPPAADGPSAAVRQYIDAVGAGRYEEMAALMDPAALEKLRDMLLPVLLEVPASAGATGVLLLDGVPNAEKARQLSGSEFMAAFFKGIARQNPAFGEAMRSASGEIIGSVPEGTGLVHVVCRSRAKAGDITMTKMTVVSVLRVGDTWRIVLSGEIEGLAESIRKNLSR